MRKSTLTGLTGLVFAGILALSSGCFKDELVQKGEYNLKESRARSQKGDTSGAIAILHEDPYHQPTLWAELHTEDLGQKGENEEYANCLKKLEAYEETLSVNLPSESQRRNN